MSSICKSLKLNGFPPPVEGTHCSMRSHAWASPYFSDGSTEWPFTGVSSLAHPSNADGLWGSPSLASLLFILLTKAQPIPMSAVSLTSHFQIFIFGLNCTVSSRTNYTTSPFWMSQKCLNQWYLIADTSSLLIHSTLLLHLSHSFHQILNPPQYTGPQVLLIFISYVLSPLICLLITYISVVNLHKHM